MLRLVFVSVDWSVGSASSRKPTRLQGSPRLPSLGLPSCAACGQRLKSCRVFRPVFSLFTVGGTFGAWCYIPVRNGRFFFSPLDEPCSLSHASVFLRPFPFFTAFLPRSPDCVTPGVSWSLGLADRCQYVLSQHHHGGSPPVLGGSVPSVTGGAFACASACASVLKVWWGT